MNAIRDAYVDMGVEHFYRTHANTYQNPHEQIIHDHLAYYHHQTLIDTTNVADLCCGSGEVTRYFQRHGVQSITGIDPFTHQAYRNNTRQPCFSLDFKDIAEGKLNTERYSLIICSFALHLAETSLLPSILFNLASVSDQLLILSPHKKPDIAHFWTIDHEHYDQKVRSRLFSNTINLKD